MTAGKWIGAAVLVVVAGGVAVVAFDKQAAKPAVAPVADKFDLPVTQVKRGEVRFTVSAKGELQGANSEMLVAPMTGSRELIITDMRKAGEMVQAGAVVVRFDTTDQEFALAEAEADVAETEQQVGQAEAETAAKEEETRESLEQAKFDLKLAQLEARRNPLVASIIARQNDLAVAAAEDKLKQLENDVAQRKASARASIVIQEAARNKAQVKAQTAKKNIDAMTLKAKAAGYVNIQQNMNGNFMFWGMSLPVFKVGDTARAGMAVAQIPDMSSYEIRAQIAEMDRGHLEVGQPAEIQVVALPGKPLKGRVKNIGGTNGPPWERKFECVFSVDNPVAELRPGMSTRIVVTTKVLGDALWLPSQALFESDGKTFVYAQNGKSFSPKDVKLVRRSESQVVVEGLKEGQVVAMASPESSTKKKESGGGAMKALQGRGA